MPRILLLLALALSALAGCSNSNDTYNDLTNGYTLGSSNPTPIASSPYVLDSYTVSGTIQYEDRLYDSGGFDVTPPTQLLPVRFTQVELVTELTGGVLARATTDATGAYSLSAKSTGQVYLRVLAATDPTQAPPVEVRDMAGDLIADTYHFTPTQGANTLDVTIPAANRASGPFNILDVLTYGGQFFESLTGGTPPGLLRAFWSTTNTYGTGYASKASAADYPGGSGIYVCGACNVSLTGVPDTDEYDDDVLRHEYGHFVEDSFGALDSPGGHHSLTDPGLDLRLAWSEGWGDFMSGAVKAWVAATNSSAISERPTASGLYVDTLGGISGYPNTVGVAYDFTTAPSISTSSGMYTPRYDTNEASVAKVLHDTLSATSSMQPIWDIETKNFAPAAVTSTMETFADDWTLNANSATTLTTALTGRQIDFAPDAYEPNDSLAQATPLTVGTPLNATLYPAGDLDYYSFQAAAGTSYQVETCNLWNAADTTISVTQDGVNVLASNDNAPSLLSPSNDGVSLRSLLTFTPLTSGTYYVEVTRSPVTPIWAGRYGNYTLSVGVGTPCN